MNLKELRAAILMWRRDKHVHQDTLAELIGEDITPTMVLFGVTEEEAVKRAQWLWEGRTADERNSILSNTLAWHDTLEKEREQATKNTRVGVLAELLAAKMNDEQCFAAELLALSSELRAGQGIQFGDLGFIRADVVRDLLRSLKKRPHRFLFWPWCADRPRHVAPREAHLELKWGGVTKGHARLVFRKREKRGPYTPIAVTVPFALDTPPLTPADDAEQAAYYAAKYG